MSFSHPFGHFATFYPYLIVKLVSQAQLLANFLPLYDIIPLAPLCYCNNKINFKFLILLFRKLLQNLFSFRAIWFETFSFIRKLKKKKKNNCATWHFFCNRCGRLREIKCCTRKARVAPAESPAACCPPERRCGAICRRVFGRCKCKRNADTQQRTRNTRAKHSITSVAPPPLSEVRNNAHNEPLCILCKADQSNLTLWKR